MKRLMLCLLAALLLCTWALADEVVELADVIVTYTPPEGFYLLTRESSASAFTAVGLRQRDLVPWMEQNSCYAVMYALEEGSELLLYLAPMEETSLDAMTSRELEQLCAYWAADYEQDGCENVSTVIYESANGRFLQTAYKTYTNDGTPCWVLSLTAFRSGCLVQLSLFMYGAQPSEEINRRVLAMADSLQVELPASLTELSAHGVTIRMQMPAGLTLQSDVSLLTGLTPETAAGEVIGAAAAEDGSWYVQWQLVEGVTGDLERVRDTGLRSLYEDRARQKAAAGFTVTAKAAVTDLRQTYVYLEYEIPQTDGESWYAAEYYTKQDGWGVVVTAYSIGQPMTEEASALLLELVSAQMITVKAE